MFNVERATCILVHRHKKFLYRLVRNPETGTDEYHEFPITYGLCGYVTAVGNLVYTQEAAKDIRF